MAKQVIKVKVLLGFRCKNTGKEYEQGQVVELPKARAEELNGTFVKKTNDALTEKRKKRSDGCGCC